MKLNRQFQDQHMEQQSANWVLKQQLERDICLLYHQLANYSYIMGDLYYGDVFALAYWDHLQLPAIDDADRDFIRDGCLVMILAMASECIDGTGSYLRPHVPQCRAKLERLSTADSDADKLIGIVRRASTSLSMRHLNRLTSLKHVFGSTSATFAATSFSKLMTSGTMRTSQAEAKGRPTSH